LSLKVKYHCVAKQALCDRRTTAYSLKRGFQPYARNATYVTQATQGFTQVTQSTCIRARCGQWHGWNFLRDTACVKLETCFGPCVVYVACVRLETIVS